RRGEVSSAALTEACLARVTALEPQILAWAHLDREGALAAARERDVEARAARLRGPLHGVPVGIKDIFDVAGMPTTAGARAFAHTWPARDSAAVARLRAAGAVILGKTHTTQFAFRDPAPTHNPWDAAHTPGGSSSGSAAAVATRMVPCAIGRQLFDRADADLRRHLEGVVERLAQAGARVTELTLPPPFADIHAAGQVVLEVEAATYHQPAFAKHAADYGPGMRDMLQIGL